ncbi:hypothetical protein KSP40_PGU012694 [Platanthera guangdongensis]|uniref:alpha-galactosidase n=1 Tax=Platanthera guangdongensis TaxID=2320717 RepID=A0ABR2M7N6_9ASPA
MVAVDDRHGSAPPNSLEEDQKAIISPTHVESTGASAMEPSPLLLLFTVLILSSRLFVASGHDAGTPPRGWNSYDSFSWIVDEEAFLANAQVVSSKLLPFGYEYVVIDYLWYRKRFQGTSSDPYGYDNLDEWGRLVPDPDRWPSSRSGQGFKEVAQKVHDMGLKFGIHVMRGISLEAVNRNRTILDVITCFLKQSCGDGRLLSLLDCRVCLDFAAAKKIGADGLHGNSWPDLDMLPLGWLTDPGNSVKHSDDPASLIPVKQRQLLDEHGKSVLRLTGCSSEKAKSWSIIEDDRANQICWNYNVKGTLLNYILHPLIFETTKIFSVRIIKTPAGCARGLPPERKVIFFLQESLLFIFAFAYNLAPHRFPIKLTNYSFDAGEIYLSFFNLSPVGTTIYTNVRDLSKVIDSKFVGNSSCDSHEVWTGKNFAVVGGTLSATVQGHGSAVFVLNCHQ